MRIHITALKMRHHLLKQKNKQLKKMCVHKIGNHILVCIKLDVQLLSNTNETKLEPISYSAFHSIVKIINIKHKFRIKN